MHPASTNPAALPAQAAQGVIEVPYEEPPDIPGKFGDLLDR